MKPQPTLPPSFTSYICLFPLLCAFDNHFHILTCFIFKFDARFHDGHKADLGHLHLLWVHALPPQRKPYLSHLVKWSGYPRRREDRENDQNNSLSGKTGNLEILSKHRDFCLNTGKTQGILLARVVNVLILKVRDIAIVAAKKSFFFPEAG